MINSRPNGKPKGVPVRECMKMDTTRQEFGTGFKMPFRILTSQIGFIGIEPVYFWTMCTMAVVMDQIMDYCHSHGYLLEFPEPVLAYLRFHFADI